MQIWVASGQGPSQVGAIDCSQTMGSQLQPPLAALVSGTQTVSGGQSPSQFGNGDWSHWITGGWQRQASTLLMNSHTWVGSEQGPSQVGARDSSQGTGTQRHSWFPALVSGMQIVPGGQSPSHVG